MPAPFRSMTDAVHWQARSEAGSRLAIRTAAWVARRLGRRVIHFLLYPTVLYFYLVRAPERRASRAFLSRALKRPARETDVVRHFLSFARVATDRFFALSRSPAAREVRFVRDERIQEVMEDHSAGVFVTAHFGSFDAPRIVDADRREFGIRIVLDKGVNARFVSVMEEVDPAMAKRIIDSEQGAAALGVSIAEAFRDGEWVGFMADRCRPGDRTLSLPFLGGQAAFPLGPYLVACAFKAPIICIFCRLDPPGYEVHCEVLWTGGHIPRSQRASTIAALARGYAERLERHVRAAPFSWFNFFDFWAQHATEAHQSGNGTTA